VAAGVLAYLRAAGVAVLPGLSDAELARAEAKFGFAFPHDLRVVLALGVPSGLRFPDWWDRAGLCAALDLTAAADPHEAAATPRPRGRPSFAAIDPHEAGRAPG